VSSAHRQQRTVVVVVFGVAGPRRILAAPRAPSCAALDFILFTVPCPGASTRAHTRLVLPVPRIGSSPPWTFINGPSLSVAYSSSPFSAARCSSSPPVPGCLPHHLSSSCQARLPRRLPRYIPVGSVRMRGGLRGSTAAPETLYTTITFLLSSLQQAESMVIPFLLACWLPSVLTRIIITAPSSPRAN